MVSVFVVAFSLFFFIAVGLSDYFTIVDAQYDDYVVLYFCDTFLYFKIGKDNSKYDGYFYSEAAGPDLSIMNPVPFGTYYHFPFAGLENTFCSYYSSFIQTPPSP